MLGASLLVGGQASGEPSEPVWPAVATPRPFADDHEDVLRALLVRVWLKTDLAPWRPVWLNIVDGLTLNALAGPRTISISRSYLRWASQLPGPQSERVLARTLAHELAHIALGHGPVQSARAELEAEALGLYYFELAGFDCRWWVDYVRAAEETDGRRGWPALHEVIEHDAQACARVRTLLGRDVQKVGERP